MGVIRLKNAPSIVGYAAVVGKKEYEGPIGADFDLHDETDTFGMDTWEKSESEMQRIALNLALSRAESGAFPRITFGRGYRRDLCGRSSQSVHGLRLCPA